MPRPTDIIISPLDGKRAVVTGGNSGLGAETARRLAAAGASVVLTSRDPERGEDAAGAIRDRHPGVHVEVGSLDLADLASVRDFAARQIEAGPIDILVDNAGVMAPPDRRETRDGFELQLGTNHLGHFALTGLLLPALQAADAPRVVVVSSLAHWMGRIAFGDLQSEDRYSPWAAYGQAKLANLLFMRRLQALSDDRAWGLTAVAAHPGVTSTNLAKNGPGSGPQGVMSDLAAKFGPAALGQDVRVGALPQIQAATGLGVHPGDYYGPAGPGGMSGMPHLAASSPWSKDPELARRLWDASEQLTGVVYPA